MKLPRISLLSQVSCAHLVSHLHIMALPALLPVLPGQMGVGYVELGLALSIFNVVSALVQAPLGFAVDRFGARRMLTFGLLLGSVSFLSLGLLHSYYWLLVAMGLAGFANGIYHPADYSLLSSGIDERKVGRAFSVHTFAGYAGGALAPAVLLGIAAWRDDTRLAFAAAGVAGLLAIVLLWLPTRERPTADASTRKAAAARTRRSGTKVFTPVVFALTFLFVLLSLSGGSIQNFSVSALLSGYDVPLAIANGGLTAFMFASAFGVLSGGALADRTVHHGTVAAVALSVAALLVALIPLFGIQGYLLVAVLGVAGFLFGIIAPSRDMLVRAAAPVGAEGRVFGIVSTGFNIGGAVGPVLFGWLLDSGRPQGVFWSAVLFLLFTVAISLLQERRTAQRRALPEAAAAR
jgi:MFS family permease